MSKHLTDADILRMKRLQKEGKTTIEIAKLLGVERHTVMYHTYPGYKDRHKARQKRYYEKLTLPSHG